MLTLLPKGAKNLADQEFEDLTALYIIGTEPGQGAIWNCVCKCGSERQVAAMYLRAGRITCCEACARARRTIQLLASSKDARSKRAILPSNASPYERNWEHYLTGMNSEERARYDEYIHRRERLNIAITPQIRASAVDVVMREFHHMKRAA